MMYYDYEWVTVYVSIKLKNGTKKQTNSTNKKHNVFHEQIKNSYNLMDVI